MRALLVILWWDHNSIIYAKFSCLIGIEDPRSTQQEQPPIQKIGGWYSFLIFFFDPAWRL